MTSKIAMLTCYDYHTAKIMDACGIDMILVGDSMGMAVYGRPTTRGVKMSDMLRHTRAVSGAVRNALVIADMPYKSYKTPAIALKNARRLIKEGGAKAVKLEGGVEIIPQIKALVKAKIPIMGHAGLLPQSVSKESGFKVQGRDRQSAGKILRDCRALQKAGVFALVLECIPAKLAREITAKLTIPTIGIGAGKYCTGQVLVYQDMLGLNTGHTPKFAKKFADAGALLRKAFMAYVKEVKGGKFPSREHSFNTDYDKNG
ncbi:MAG: 3-methyl-2-oxobutanoate hydroxymethyltransferase [Elusimicrobiota bacterium]|jgi:3-methyl-2-oxobutanoate hydroxymethyltransferase|nr:3-methyl-2-oxobutanoate hydroxymethyltransferase [Elusimicrobiota bacterium]